MPRSSIATSALSRTLAFAGVVLGLSFGGCDCGAPAVGADAGPAGEGEGEGEGEGDCPAGTADCPCRAGQGCDADLVCQGDTCVACTFGTLGCPCADGACDLGDVCDSASVTCRAATSCEAAGCAQHQLCDVPPGQDATCLADCDDGYTFDTATNACEATPSCDPTAPGFLTCPEGVACDDTAGAVCNGCLPGYVDFDGTCLADTDCAAYCGPNRACTLPDASGNPAVCGDCTAGSVLDDATGRCIDVITCAELTCGPNEQCTVTAAGQDATCVPVGNCPTGEVDPGNGNCVACVDCFEDLGGGNLVPNEGVTGVGNGGHAFGSRCVCQLEQGYFQSIDDGAVKKCDADDDGWVNADILPVLRLNSGQNPFAQEEHCTVRTISEFDLEADIPPAAGPQTTTRAITIAELVTAHGIPSSAIQIDSAGRKFVSLIEPEILDDPTLFALRYQSNDPRERLFNYGGFTGGTGDPGLTPNQLTAAEANPLTKECNQDADDLNFDSVPDVTQSQLRLPGAGFLSDTLEQTPVFYRMSYFIELDRGFFRDRTAECAASGESPCHGAYVIREKSRSQGPASPDGLEPTYVNRSVDSFDASYWEQCARSRDPNYNAGLGTEDTLNMDFAFWSTGCSSAVGSCLVETDLDGDGVPDTGPHVAYDGRAVRANATLANHPVDLADDGSPRWPGMNHSSQFKCVSFGALPAAQAQRKPPTGNFDLNECHLDPRSVQGASTGADPTNPRDPLMTCVPGVPTSAAKVGFNYWAPKVPSTDVTAPYNGGCINEGGEWSYLCAASKPSESVNAAENNLELTFGQLFCACGANRSGSTCQIGCASGERLLDGAATTASVALVNGELRLARTWMCAYPSASHETLTGTDGTTNITLVGEVPSSLVPAEPLTATDAVRGVVYSITAPPVR